MSKDLLPNQVKFLECYLEDPRITNAAIAAGYAPNSAYDTGKRILGLPLAQKYLEEAGKKAAADIGLTAHKVLKELSKIAFADPGDVVTTDEEGDPEIKVGKMTGTEVSITSTSGKNKAKITSVKTIKNSDKIAALGLIMKHMGMTKDKVEVDHKGSLLELIEKSYEKKLTEIEQPAPVLLPEPVESDPEAD